MPVFPLTKQLRRESLVRGQPERLGQRHQMLVTVEFPGNFAVSNLGEIKIANLKPGFSGSPLFMHPIAVPVNFRSVVQVFVTQQVKPVLTDSLGTLDDLISFLGKQIAQSRAQMRHRIGRKKEMRIWTRRAASVQPRFEACANFVAQKVRAGGGLLPQPVGKLLRTHR